MVATGGTGVLVGLATGERGAVAAAHALATAAGLEILGSGGSAVDAALAAQAVICVAMPQAAGLGGDVLMLVRTASDGVVAVGGTGLSPTHVPDGGFVSTGGGAVTVPGLVDGWVTAHSRWGRLDLAVVLGPAIELARTGLPLSADLHSAVEAQRVRLLAGGADAWALLRTSTNAPWRQPELADLLIAIAASGRDAFYKGAAASAICTAIRRCGGSVEPADLASQQSLVGRPVSVAWDGGQAHVQPPSSQGILLAMALAFVQNLQADESPTDHLLVEVTEAAFAFRSGSARGLALLGEPLAVDRERASGRGGPRAYLHTAGVAAADAEGMVVSSLISVFDDFGSGVFVPELGIVLNNRAAGFTDGDNAPAPGKRPVHTLAPAMLERSDGSILALATPGADGQVQTILQILTKMRHEQAELSTALAAPRWRSESGRLLLEADHPCAADLRRRGHKVNVRSSGDPVFGAVVAAGLTSGVPFAAADWRRDVSCAAR